MAPHLRGANYRRHYFMARGIHASGVATEFLAHSNEELGHADELADLLEDFPHSE